MIPAPFEYFAPRTLDDAIRLLERHGDEAKLLAGGHSLLPLMKLRLAAPRYVIDLGKLSGLSFIKSQDNFVAIGALTTHAQIENSDLLRGCCPLLPETAAEIGDVQVRNRGTLGGSLVHADPAADYPASILALDAEMLAVGTSGPRSIPAAAFFVDMLTSALRPGEILTEVRVRKNGTRTGAAYCKLHQPASGFAVVGVAACTRLDAKGAMESVCIGLTGVGPKAFRASASERMLQGKKPTQKLLSEAARHVADGTEILADIHASKLYRKEMAIVFAQRALEHALERAGRHGGRRG